MGLYGHEGDDAPTGRFDQILSLLIGDHGWAREIPPAWTRRIPCARCPSVATFVAAGGIDLVYAQMSLWRRGWRRDPDTGLDYCPACCVDGSPPSG